MTASARSPDARNEVRSKVISGTLSSVWTPLWRGGQEKRGGKKEELRILRQVGVKVSPGYCARVY